MAAAQGALRELGVVRGADTLATEDVRVAGGGALGERIRRYWSAVEATRRVGPGAAATADGIRSGDRIVHQDAVAPPSGARPGTALDEAQIASALAAFEAGRPFDPLQSGNGRRSAGLEPPPLVDPDWSGTRAVGGSAGRPAAPHYDDARRNGAVWPRPGSIGGGPSRASALRALADDVGEILREQAIRHGIDVP